MDGVDVLDRFSPAARDWFTGAFAAPTPAQAAAWDAIGAGENTLVVAPTGSGKTLAAFLWALDRLAAEPPPEDPKRRCRVLYVSPLKALAVDVERNLRAPLAGLRQAARRLGAEEPDVRVGIRSGDTPADERRRFGTKPPDVLITTPESLFLILTSRAREALAGVETVIVDEVHAVAGTKRGAHLALSLERLDDLLERPAQRVGLSATVRPVETVAAYLGGPRPATVVQPPHHKAVELSVVVPVEDMSELGRPGASDDQDPAASSIWPHVEERILDLITAHRSTIVFANSRRLAERLCARLNDLHQERLAGTEGAEAAVEGVFAPPAEVMAQAGAGSGAPPEVARAHHGSVSKEERAAIEEALKEGRLPAVVATSSLELGIDMGAVDLVIQVESPPSVAGGLQRVGRAGHQVGATSRGVVFPKYRGDLVQTAVVAERMDAGAIEELHPPRNPLDVLAQQIVAMTAMDDWQVDDLAAMVRRAAPFAELPRSALDAVLDMLSGRYPSDEFAELRPRLVWDRPTGALRGRPGAQRLAVTSGGTIPDRGLFGVFLVGEKQRRVGELDEEMVYESRVGDVFVLGASSWRIEDITHDRVLVSPAPGRPGRLPFWHGDTPGRPAELGAALGAFCRELAALSDDEAAERARRAGLDEWAAGNLVRYLSEQRASTGYVPDDRTLVVERFRDELGDWRVVVHSPYGARVHAPWALAIGARLRERYGVDVQAIHTDDGIILRVPDTDAAMPDSEGGPPTEIAVFDSAEVEEIVTGEVGASALFASRFRECAARALLLPRRRPGGRTPLWQQRQRSAQLLSVAGRYDSFPVVLETVRECLQDVFDVPALVELMRDIAARRVRLVEVETQVPSPFAASMLFHYVGAFIYEGDAPLAERRAQALALDTALLSELLGQADLRELLDAEVVEETETSLQRLVAERHVRDLEGVADLLRELGPLATAEVEERGGSGEWLAELERARRVIRVRVAGRDEWSAIEDSGRLRDALGVPLPVGVPEAFTEPVVDPLGDLVSRFARTHGPFTVARAAARFGLGVAVVEGTLRRLAADGRVVSGEFRPGGAGEEWCDTGVLRTLRRRSLAKLRKEVEPAAPEALARFTPLWQHVGGSRMRDADALFQAVEQLQGAVVPASALESQVLPARVPGYTPALLDELTSAGEVVWAGAGPLPGTDGWVSLCLADAAPLLLPEPGEITMTPLHDQVLEGLSGGGALFFRDLSDRLGSMDDTALADALWDLVWAGRATGDTLVALRARLTTRRASHSRTTASRSATGSGSGPGSAIPPRAGRPTRRSGMRGGLSRRASMPSRMGPPTVAGRWWLLPAREPDITKRTYALAETLLDRYGIVTRGVVAAERVPGGFSAVYPVLRAFEDGGRCRRGYFVEGLGAAQFALPGAVDRMRAPLANTPARARSPESGNRPPAPQGGTFDRAHTSQGGESPGAMVLAAADPANPYGAALPWPERPGEGTHRPGRKAGALVVMVAGRLVLYVERGGRTLLSWDDTPEMLRAAADALALAVREGALGRLTVERADGTTVHDSPLAKALEEAGFRATPRGLRLRA
ncbi:MAG TPA: ATP-dependent helicase [Streptosporangiaceae bacterium]